jgi:hypothetical protein
MPPINHNNTHRFCSGKTVFFILRAVWLTLEKSTTLLVKDISLCPYVVVTGNHC